MARYRRDLPQLSGELFITDGGLETTLYFTKGFELPEFAAFVLLDQPGGREAMEAYFDAYADIARHFNLNFILESATWRASPDWGRKLGYDRDALADINRRAIDLLQGIRARHDTGAAHWVISGCMGSRGDGYDPKEMMTIDESRDYHRDQVHMLRQTEADMVTAFTIPYAEEAIGLTRAARDEDMPVAIGFTVETDGRLPSGQHLKEAVRQVDAATDNGPAYYMINCAHPTHFHDVLEPGAAWTKRIRAIRANASASSHAELEAMEELDDGNPQEFGRQYRALVDQMPHLNILGGCCGTDQRHVEAICRAVLN
jgi:S-methylmethionine-dependent homocysteine/selenocysteine methylase